MDIRRGSTAMPLRALVIWFALLVLAMANGGFREAVLIPRFGLHTGHIVSTLMLCAGILIVTYLAVPWIHPGSRGDAFAIGLAWLALTLAFESGLVARAASLGRSSWRTVTRSRGASGCSCSSRRPSLPAWPPEPAGCSRRIALSRASADGPAAVPSPRRSW